MVWFIDQQGSLPCLQLSVEKVKSGAWGSSLCAKGGTLEYWNTVEEEPAMELPNSFIHSALPTKVRAGSQNPCPTEHLTWCQAWSSTGMLQCHT